MRKGNRHCLVNLEGRTRTSALKLLEGKLKIHKEKVNNKLDVFSKGMDFAPFYCD